MAGSNGLANVKGTGEAVDVGDVIGTPCALGTPTE